MELVPGRITVELRGLQAGLPGALDRLGELICPELYRRAAELLRKEHRRHTLQPEDLAHAVLANSFLRNPSSQENWFEDRRRLFAAFGHRMKMFLIDYGRKKRAARYGGDCVRIDFEDVKHGLTASGNVEIGVVAKDLVERLDRQDALAGRIFRLWVVYGYTAKEIAKQIDVSSRTVQRKLKFCCDWLESESSS